MMRAETYELLVSFLVEGQEYGLYIPLDPFFVVARINGSEATPGGRGGI